MAFRDVMLLLLLVPVVISQRPRYQIGYDCQDEYQRGVRYSCEECWFTQVPETIPNRTECVILSHNQIMNFKQDDFSNIIKLRKLWLHGNPSFNLNSIYSNRHFGNLEALHLTGNTLLSSPSELSLVNLTFLDISGNSLKDILDVTFRGLPNLKTLDISGNQFDYLGQDSFKKLPQSLHGLMLNDAFIKTADDAFARLSALEHLTLDGNQFTGVPSGLPSSLTVFSIVDNPILKTYRGSFDNLPNLQNVTLHANAIGQETFLGAWNLQSIKLKTCRIESFAFLGAEYVPQLEMYTPCSKPQAMTIQPSAFVGLSRITKILLVGTTLSWIPPRAFADLPRLTEVWLFGNAVERVADDAFQGSPIKQIVMYSNQLRSVPPNLPHTLESLSLSNNPINEIKTSSFELLSRLEHISISASTIDTDAFKNLPNIQYFSLNTCELRSYALRGLNQTHIRLDRACGTSNGIVLHNYSFSGIKGLTEIRITESGLKQIPSHAFADLPDLRILQLNRNSIRDVSMGILSGSNNVEWMSLSSNQLKLIPEDLPASIKQLDICCNQISQLLSFPYLPNLEKLTVTAGAIMNDAFSNTPSVTDLDVRSCKLGSYSFRGLNKIRTLEIKEKCRFSNEPMILGEYAFSGMNNVEVINLEYNRISSIPGHLFDGLKKLKHVDLSHNDISQVDIDSFANADGMTSLLLQSNRLTSVPRKLPTTLQELQLSINDIPFLDSDSFPLLPNLRNLTINTQQIRKNAFRNCGNLNNLNVRTCDIEGNSFRSLEKLIQLNVGTCSGWNSQLRLQEEAFVGLTSLTDLSMYYAEISIVPARSFKSLNKLRHLSLEGNKITYFDPTALEGCSNLRELGLGNNQLTKVPENLPTSLKDLSLERNSITSLNRESFNRSMPSLSILSIDTESVEQDAFYNLGNITNLDLQTCDIHSYAMRSLKKITILDLSPMCSSGLVAANHSFSGMTSLRNLTVIRMHNLPQKVFSGLPNLRGLMLSRPTIESIPLGLLDGLHNLEWFRMNAVTTLTDSLILSSGVFNTANLNRLSNIMMEDADLISIEAGALSNLPALRRLHLGGNKLTTLDPTSFQNTPSILSVSITGNRWRCDCNLRWLKILFDSGRIAFDRYPVCTSPSSLSKRRFDKLTPDDFTCTAH